MNGLLASARHVLEHVFDESGNQKSAIGIFQFLADDIYLYRKLLRFAGHADVAVAVTAPMTNNKTGLPLQNKILALTTRDLSTHETVFTYAYPNTVHVAGEKQEIHFNPRFYAGEISDFFPDGRDITFLPRPCYQTSMTIHNGASGGPVFGMDGKVCGTNSTGYAALPDISFISSVKDLLPLTLDDIQLQPDGPVGSVSISKLIELGHIRM